MNLYWLQQTTADVPADNDWLSADETLRLDALRFPKRRADWRLGRWTAKRAIAAYLHLPAHPGGLAAIDIRPAPSGAPEVFLPDGPAAITISLSHSAGTAACVISPFPAAVGCDLEVVEPRGHGFCEDYFTLQEQAAVAEVAEADRPSLVTLLWSAKESALKALRVGLRADTRSVQVSLVDPIFPGEGAEDQISSAADAKPPQSCNGWRALRVACNDGQIFQGWWRKSGNMLHTVVADPAPAMPMLLDATPAEHSNLASHG